MQTSAADSAYPSLERLVQLRALARGFRLRPHMPLHNVLLGQHAARMRGRGLDFEELRHYRPGDDVRYMDWKVTRRLGKPHIRVYNEERERPTLLALDLRVSMFFGSHHCMKSVIAAEAAALLGWYSLSVGDRVGAVLATDTDISHFVPRRSAAHVNFILANICEQARQLEVGAPPDAGRLNQMLTRLQHLARHDAQVCVISDFHGADTETAALLQAIARHNDLLLVFVFDPLELYLPQEARLPVTDGRVQISVDGRSTALREKYEAAFNSRLQRARDLLLGWGVPVLELSTERPAAQQLRAILRQH